MADAQQPSPPKIETGSIDVAGRALPFQRAGTGPAVLLLHPASATSDAQWGELLRRLGKRYTTVSVSTGDLAKASGGAGEGSTQAMVATVLALCRALRLERPFAVGSGAGAVVAYAIGRSEPSALRGLMLLDTLVPGIAPWKAEGDGPAWTMEATLNASHNAPSELPLVLALGEASPHASQIVDHAVALRAHGWSRVETALVPMAFGEAIVDQVGPVGTLVERLAG